MSWLAGCGAVRLTIEVLAALIALQVGLHGQVDLSVGGVWGIVGKIYSTIVIPEEGEHAIVP